MAIERTQWIRPISTTCHDDGCSDPHPTKLVAHVGPVAQWVVVATDARD